MEIPNLFRTIVNKALQTGYFTLDELAILRNDPDCWKWLTDYFPVYERLNPVLTNVSDIVEKD